MNSRGTLMAHRITGDTLAISDSVAMTPTVHPAAAGAQRSREVDRLRGRDAVRVTNREDIRSGYGISMPRRHGIGRAVMTAKLSSATVSGEVQRQPVESHSHRWPGTAQRSGHWHT